MAASGGLLASWRESPIEGAEISSSSSSCRDGSRGVCSLALSEGRRQASSRTNESPVLCDRQPTIIASPGERGLELQARLGELIRQAFQLLLLLPLLLIIAGTCCRPAEGAFAGQQRQFATRGNNRSSSASAPGSSMQARSVQSASSGGLDEARASHWSLPNRPSLFSIIRFPNEECFDSSNQSGTCYTAFECKLLGGQPSSPCAAGFGSCCIVSRTCHVTTREKVIYFKNPSYPAADSDEKFCDLTVEISDANVCQLRLDFLDFQLDPPIGGACTDDYMEISASGMPPQTVPRLCGLNRNQHLYITLPQDFSERSASIVFYTDPVGDHRWQLKVTQIDCNQYKPIDWRRGYGKLAVSPLWNPHPNAGVKLPPQYAGKYSTTFASGFQTLNQAASALAYEFLRPQYTPRAPMGCLQYFTQPSGIIESFNFGHYLNNMDYAICVQRQPDTCRVVFTSSDYDWSLNGVGIAGANSGVGDQDCARDYLLIPGASRTGDGFTYDRYCGGRLHYYRGQALSAPVVTKAAGPIVLRFHSDANHETLNNGGFRLQYEQSAQDCIYHTAEESGSLSSQQLLASTLADSRPLAEPPVMYAAQQFAPTPMHQLTSSSELTNVVQPADLGGKRPAQHTQQAEQQFGGAEVQQQQLSSHNNIKRNDYSMPPLLQPEWPSIAAAGSQAELDRNRNNNLLLGELSKAFQLITAA